MRVLILAAAVFASATAVPSGLLTGHGLLDNGLSLGYAAPLALAHAAPIAVAHGPALPTISPGDIHGAAIDAHVEASDHARAAVDAAREYHDQASELQGRAINAAEDHSWQAVDAIKTAEAQLDGAAAGAAPILAKQLAGHVAPVVASHAYAAPVVAGHAYSAPAVATSKTVVTQSLSQSHPAPVHTAVVAHAAPIAHSAVLSHAAPLAHSAVVAHAAPVAYGAHLDHGYAHGLEHAW